MKEYIKFKHKYKPQDNVLYSILFSFVVSELLIIVFLIFFTDDEGIVRFIDVGILCIVSVRVRYSLLE